MHVKTAGTNWLEEVIGLAEAGGEGLDLAKEIYAKALEQAGCAVRPYAAVIDIDARQAALGRDGQGLVGRAIRVGAAARPEQPGLQPVLRQLIHVGYKIAAQMGERYLKMLRACEKSDLQERHGKPVRAASAAAVPGGEMNMKNLFDLSQETAVVIGGTGTLGGGMAEALAAAGRGWRSWAENAERGQERVRAIEAAGGRAVFQPADAMDRQSLTKARDAILSQWGAITVLVNAAGGNKPEATSAAGRRLLQNAPGRLAQPCST